MKFSIAFVALAASIAGVTAAPAIDLSISGIFERDDLSTSASLSRRVGFPGSEWFPGMQGLPPSTYMKPKARELGKGSGWEPGMQGLPPSTYMKPMARNIVDSLEARGYVPAPHRRDLNDLLITRSRVSDYI